MVPPVKTGSGESALAMERSVAAGELTEVVAVALLFAGLGSGVVDDTDTVFARPLPAGAVTATWIVTVAMPVAGRVPRFMVAVFPTSVVGHAPPCVDVQDTKVVPAGSGSLTTTLNALVISGVVIGESLLTLMV